MDRITKARDFLKKNKLGGMLISSNANITYFLEKELFLSFERDAFLFITPKKQYILTYQMYEEPAKRIKSYELRIMNSEDPLTGHLKEIGNDIKVLGIEEDNLTVAEFKKISEVFKKTQHIELLEPRAEKEESEIEKIEKACGIGDSCFKFILGKLKANFSEKQISNEILNFIKNQGADISFESIVAFGENSSVPHHKVTDRKLKKGDFVLLDFGVKYESYCSDMTRTLVFGKASEKQKRMHKTILKAQEEAVKLINTSRRVTGHEVDAKSREVVKKMDFPDYPHSLGHGIGLEVHEHRVLAPNSKMKIEEGMVFSIEPGVYIPGFGGVRIEDLYVFEKGKLRALTKSPKVLEY